MVEVKTITLPSGETETVEIGLSPGQTAGTVGGEYVVRPEGSDVMETYIPGTGSTSILIEGGATAGRGGRGVGATTIVRRDPYGNIIGIKQVGPTGETIFERKATPGGGYVEENLPFSLQPRFAEIERTRAEMPLYRQMAVQPAIVAAPAPLQLETTQAYPSTPIDYTRTHVSELYSYPLYKGASFVSRGLQSYYERFIDIFPTPEPVKEVQKGVGSVFIGIPEFIASGIAGWEYAAREPEVFKKEVVPAVKTFGAGLAEQATERPYYTAGQAVGLAMMFRGGARQPKLLEAPKTEPLKLPSPELLPRPPKGMEGLELLRLPERPGISKPIVIEGVKTIKEKPAEIPEQYRAALERGAAPISERGVMGIRFGSRGYRPAGAAKPENIFTTGEFKKFLKEEKAVSYVPTFERLKAEPQIKQRVQVMTAERTYVLPSLRNLQVAKTVPKSSFKIAVLPKVSTRTVARSITLTQPKITTVPKLSTEPLTKLMVAPSTATRISVMPAVQVKTALKQLTQQQTKTLARTATRTQTVTRFDLGVKKLTKTKIKSPFTNGKLKMTFGRKGFKFPELTRVATPGQIMKGFKL